MGNTESSSVSRERHPSEENSVEGLLPIGNLAEQNYNIENLVFAGGSAEGFSYAGAVGVLEKLSLLQRVKRFAGVGPGAIVAAFLAFGLDSKETQSAFNEHLTNILVDDQLGYDDLPESLSKNYGWNSGAKFTDWFGRFLESRSFPSEMTFLQLYEKTGKELCVIVTNVDKLILEYCHAKTTPDLPIKLAVFMSLSIPGIFVPLKYGPGIERYHYVSGSLMCNYPIHAFDGWLLSMDREDSFLRLESPTDYVLPAKVFDFRNERTLGFFHIDKHKEVIYKELVDRLIYASADLKIPSTTLGEKYKAASEKRHSATEKFSRLQKACTTLLSMADELEHEGEIPVAIFAERIFTDESLSRDDCVLFFPEFGGNQDDLESFLCKLFNVPGCPQSCLEDFLQRKLLSALNDYSDHYKNNVTNLHTYFSMVFAELPYSAMSVKNSDFDRSVGILCGHVGSCDVDLEEADQTFLYRQGWNATVSYFRQIDTPSVDSPLA